MSAATECQECRRSVREDELAEGDDGRLLCCCCRLKELEDELAEKGLSERASDQDPQVAELVCEARAGAPRDLPPSEPDSDTWASLY